MSEERDFVLARLAAARGHIAVAGEALDTCVALFLYPEDDKKGEERGEALDAISTSAGEISRSIESAQSIFETLNKEQLSEEEPDDDEDGSDESDSSED